MVLEILMDICGFVVVCHFFSLLLSLSPYLDINNNPLISLFASPSRFYHSLSYSLPFIPSPCKFLVSFFYFVFFLFFLSLPCIVSPGLHSSFQCVSSIVLALCPFSLTFPFCRVLFFYVFSAILSTSCLSPFPIYLLCHSFLFSVCFSLFFLAIFSILSSLSSSLDLLCLDNEASITFNCFILLQSRLP